MAWFDRKGIRSEIYGMAKSTNAAHFQCDLGVSPDEQAQRTIEKLIEEYISKLTKTLSPKTITFSGEQKMELKS